MQLKDIRIYHTHIEIYPYEEGENKRLEKMMSLWQEVLHYYEPIGYYITENTLYLPRGVNIQMLEKMFESTAFVIREADKAKSIKGVHALWAPKDRIQEESIRFLTCTEEFANRSVYSQLALNIGTGDGKTYAAIYAILQYKLRAIIILNRDVLKYQWQETLLQSTDIDAGDIIDVKDSLTIKKIMKGMLKGYFYIVNHQTLQSYAKAYGWTAVRDFFKKICVGIKVYDECHLNFHNIIMIDFFSNTQRTFYLTATMTRSDPQEATLFRKCFGSITKFGEETRHYAEKRKHISYIPVLYRSSPTYNDLLSATNKYGFSVLAFSKYALHGDPDGSQLRYFRRAFNLAIRAEGKILITVAKIEDTEFMKEFILKEYPELQRDIRTIHSGHTKEENEDAKKNAEIICTTIKSCGTGLDIKKLRTIINLEPFSSKVTTNQLAGRLREYDKEQDTFFFDLIDMAFPQCEKQYKAKQKILIKKCKGIRVLDLT